MTERNPALWIQARTDHTAENDRALMHALFAGREGIVQPAHLAVSQRGAGANMSVDVAAGVASVLGDDNANQGTYLVWNDATANLAIAAADATNPRIDIVIARVRDAFYSGATNAFDLAVVTGTPAGSPAEPALPNNAVKLATVAVAALASSIVNANITDTRPRASTLGGRIICTSTTRPTSPLWEGLEIYETDTNRVWRYTGSAWQLIGGNAPRCRATKSAGVSVASGVTNIVTFTSETDGFDTDAIHDTGTNPSRLIVPTGMGGLWGFSYSISWALTAGAAFTYLVAYVTLNGGAVQYSRMSTVNNNAGVGHLTGGGAIPLAAGEYVELSSVQFSGGAINVGSTGTTADYLELFYIGPIL